MARRYKVERFDAAALRQTLDPAGDNRTLECILSLLAKSTDACVTTIIEFEYVDEDYRDEFAALYSRSFQAYPPRCTRYHFFSTEIRSADLKSIERFGDKYLGFMVWRPADIDAAGRTIISAKLAEAGQKYIHCVAPFFAHILGREFRIDAAPFIQQDSRVGACAHASIWMAARYMAARYGDREFTPAQISVLAKKHGGAGRLYPADRGLVTNQILAALEGMGYSCELYSIWDMPADCAPHIDRAFSDKKITPPKSIRSFREKEAFAKRIKLADIAYRYIESGLPVLFLTETHTLVGIGHTLNPSAPAHVSLQRIPAFVTNDDSLGPYREVAIWETRGSRNGRQTNFSANPGYILNEVDEIVAMMPHEVCLRGEEAERSVAELVARYTRDPGRRAVIKNVLRSNMRVKEFNLNHSNRNLPLLWRTFLMRSVVWQKSILLEKQRQEQNLDLFDLLLELEIPKYIWITEITTNQLSACESEEEMQILGYAICDSTAMPNAMCVIALLLLDTLTIFPAGKSYYFAGATPLPPKFLAYSKLRSMNVV